MDWATAYLIKQAAKSFARLVQPKNVFRPSSYYPVPGALLPSLLSGRMAPSIFNALVPHIEKYYPGLLLRPLGSGAESAALLALPSKFTRRATRETGPVVLKYGVTNPWNRAQMQLLRIRNAAPTWRWRTLDVPGIPEAEGGVQRVHTWLEPYLKPSNNVADTLALYERVKKLGLGIHPKDLFRAEGAPPQLGSRFNRIVPIDRGIFTVGEVPLYGRPKPIVLPGGRTEW